MLVSYRVNYFIKQHIKIFAAMTVLVLAAIPSIALHTNANGVGQITLNNARYAAGLDSENVASAEQQSFDDSAESIALECDDSAKLFDLVRTQMLNRSVAFTIKSADPDSENVLTVEKFASFLDKVFATDDTSSYEDYDYLKVSWTKARLTVENTPQYTKYEFSFGYLTTAQQEKALDEKTDEILKTLNVYDSSDFEKVRAVNDYITQTVSYDKSFEQVSAYDAAFNGQSVCRGYTQLTYAMLEKLDVPVRIVTGKAKRQAHVWNLVKVDGAWYNLDVTWNDSTRSDCFFLKNENEFYFHNKDAEFSTEEFVNAYPIAEASYKIS